jgi:hypothetical protein
MVQYFSEILKTFSIAQRIWALIILCISVFFITFGSKIIDVIKPDPTQQILVVKRQRNEITSLNTQLDSLSFRVNELGQEVINGQSQCTYKRIEREKEIITQIDELEKIIRNMRPRTMVKNPRVLAMKRTNDTIAVESIKVIPDENTESIMTDNTELAISALHELKNRIKNKKY